MDLNLVNRIRTKFESKETDELLSIWQQDNREGYSDEAFEAVRQILETRGQSFKPKRPIVEIRKEIERAIWKSPAGDQDGKYVCTNCHYSTGNKKSLKRCFLGHQRLICPNCQSRTTYPLSMNWRLLHFAFLLIFVLRLNWMANRINSAWRSESWAYGMAVLFGPAVIVACVVAIALAILGDFGKRLRIKKAWHEHQCKNHPTSD